MMHYVFRDGLYITDFSNNRVAKLTLSTGAFVGAVGRTTATTGTCTGAGVESSWCTGGTFASGPGDGMYFMPNGIDLDLAHGLAYVADSSNKRLVKISLITGAFIGAVGKTTASTGTCTGAGAEPTWCTGGTFVSGAGNGMLSGPVYPNVDSVNGVIYLTDQGNSRIVKITASTGAFVGAIGRTIASTGTCPAAGPATSWCTGGTFAFGTTDGAYLGPVGVGLDSTNQILYIPDSGNNRIVKVK